MPPQGGPEGVPRCCVIEPDSACHPAITIAGCDEAAIRGESYRIDLFPAPQGAQNFLPRLCADEVYALITITRRDDRRDDVTGGPVLHAFNSRVEAYRAPAARSVIVS